jgi:hypothetical protein
MVLLSRLRGGAAGSARGVKSFLTVTGIRLRKAGATGQLTVRADSASYNKAVLHTWVKFNVRFSVHCPAGHEDPGSDRREHVASDPVLAEHPGGLGR